MTELRRKPYAAALLAALGMAVGLMLLRSPSGAGGQDALLAADGGLAATTAAYGIAVWLFAAATATWFGTPPVRRAGWAGDEGVWVKGTLDEARPAAIAAGVTLALLTPIVLMAPLMVGSGSVVMWLTAVAMLVVATLAGVALGLLTARVPVLAVPILAGAVALLCVLAVRLVLVEIFIPDTLITPLGGLTNASVEGARSLDGWAPIATGAGAALGALAGGFALDRGLSPGWALLGALATPIGLGLASPLALVATGGGAVLTAITPLEWGALAIGGILGALASAAVRAVTSPRSREDAWA